MNRSRFVPLLGSAVACSLCLTGSGYALDLLGYWNFDDAGDPLSAPDLSGNAPAAAIVAPAVFSADAGGFSSMAGDRSLELGAVGNAAHALVPTGAHFDAAVTNDSIAVSFWQFNTGKGATSSFWFNAPTASSGARGFQTHLPWSDGNIYFDHSGATGAGQRMVVDDSSIIENGWQQFVLQKSASGDKEIWVDGVLVASQAGGADPLLAFDGVLVIGASINAFVSSYGGRIDEFAVWDGPLGAGQIALLVGGVSAPDLIDPTDSDGDGLPDVWENAHALDPDDNGENPNNHGVPGNPDNGAAGDPDLDASDNLEEFNRGTDPRDDDSDDDLLLDGWESGDGTYAGPGATGTDPLDPDSDGDSLIDGVEDNGGIFVNAGMTGSDPNRFDSDTDGFGDGVEVSIGADPNDPSDPAPVPELLACWNFDDISDPARAVDLVGGHVGLLQGGAAYTADAGGRTGLPGDYGIDFGPDANFQTLAVADASFLNFAAAADEITIVYWQKLVATGQSSGFWMFSPSSSGSQRGMQASAPWSNGQMYFDTAGCCDPPQRLAVADPVGDWSGWHHLAFVKDGGTKELWIDGVMAASSAGNAPLPTDFTRMLIGSGDGAGGDGFNSLQGVMDEFAIFGEALSGAEIGAVMQSLPKPSAPFAIIGIGYDGIAGRATITFNSRPGVTYAVDSSTDLSGGGWLELTDNVDSGGQTTAFTDTISAPGAPVRFYRVREAP